MFPHRVTATRVFLTGVGCVGKMTVGRELAAISDVKFFDVDCEIEAFFGSTIMRLQNGFLTIQSYRKEAAKALTHLLNIPTSARSVIVPPSGLMGAYLRAVRKSTGITVAHSDRPENIVERLAFCDIDSKRIEKDLTAEEKSLYLREIRKDITYFRKSHERADLRVDISDLDPLQSADRVKQAVEAFDTSRPESEGSE